MPQYNKTTWVNDTAPAIDATNLNKIEQGIFDSVRQDGSTTMSGQLVTTAGSASTPAIAPTGDSNTGIFFPAANTVAFAIDGQERMRFKSNGFIGISDQDPSYRLDVQSYAATPLRIQRSGEYGEVLKIGRAGVSDTAGISYPADGTFQITTAATPRITINASGFVGINNQTPTANLSVKAASDQIAAQFIAYDGSTGSALQFRNNTNASETALIWAHNTDGLILKSASGAVRLRTGSTDGLVMNSSGNVGIGTASPASKLEVSGLITRTVTVDGSTGSPAEESGIQYRHPVSASNRAGINFFNTYANNGAAWLSFLTTNTSNSYAERMRIDAAGNVGIGTISPNYKLEVAGTGTFTGASGIGAIRVSGAGGSWFWIDNDATTRMRFSSGGTAGTNPMYFTDGGFLGIGVVPNAELHIKGTGEIMRLETTAATGDNFIRFYAPSSATKGFIGYTSSGNDHLNINNVLSADLLFHTNNIERLRIESGGTTRPAANNTYDLGNSSFRWATIYAQNALNTSDARLKTDIAESSLGLDFVTSLNPVQFRYIEGGNTVERVQTGTEIVEITPAIPAQPEVPEIVDEDGNIIQEYVAAVDEIPAVTEEQPIYEEVVTPRDGVRTHFGLLAQEVKAALPEGQDFAGWALADKDDPESTQFLNYSQLIAPMIKAIQELNAKVEALEAQLAGN